MKFLLVGFVFAAVVRLHWCQDIQFPTEDPTPTYLSGNDPVVERQPLMSPYLCPENELMYPGDGFISSWVCDCKPKFLYFPLQGVCYEAYTRGPCPEHHLTMLPKGENVPLCVRNPCLNDKLVLFNNMCYEIGKPCSETGVLVVNETNFQLECKTTESIYSDLFKSSLRMQSEPMQSTCPYGSRRVYRGMCRPI